MFWGLGEPRRVFFPAAGDRFAFVTEWRWPQLISVAQYGILPFVCSPKKLCRKTPDSWGNGQKEKSALFKIRT